jgi:cell division septation protein DedD
VSPAPARGRVKSGPGSLQWIALFAAGAVVMVLTFTLGVLVGRQWSRPAPAIASIESGARKTVPPGKRGGLSGADVEEPPPIDQKLTFYQTLTAPLGRGFADASQRAEDKAKTQPAPEPARAKPPPPPDPYTSRADIIIESPAPPEATTASAPTRSQADTAGLWSVQVAAFKTQAQAGTLQKQLNHAGFDAYVASAAAADGQTNYRVRVGSFNSKAEAERMVERVRGERSPAAFVTPR